jgi:prevent-host-death family protein
MAVETVGIRALKEHASAIIRRVHEEGEAIEVTHRGRVVARIVPVAPRAARATEAVWTDLDALAAEIGARWPANVSALDAVREGRREL